MSPLLALKNFIKFDPETARFIYAGLVVFAVGAVVIGFGVDQWAAAKVGAVAIVFALVLSLVMYIAKHPVMKAVLGWMLVVTFGYFLLCVTASIFPRGPIVHLVGPQPPFTCYLGLIAVAPVSVEECEARNAPTVAEIGGNGQSSWMPSGPDRLWFAQASAVPENAKIFLQFGEAAKRDLAKSIAGGLLAEGWAVQGADLGGELVTAVPDANEVRFFKPEDRQAAIDLATSLSQLTGGEGVAVRDFSRLYPLAAEGQLEVWLGAAPTAADGGT